MKFNIKFTMLLLAMNLLAPPKKDIPLNEKFSMDDQKTLAFMKCEIICTKEVDAFARQFNIWKNQIDFKIIPMENIRKNFTLNIDIYRALLDLENFLQQTLRFKNMNATQAEFFFSAIQKYQSHCSQDFQNSFNEMIAQMSPAPSAIAPTTSELTFEKFYPTHNGMLYSKITALKLQVENNPLFGIQVYEKFQDNNAIDPYNLLLRFDPVSKALISYESLQIDRIKDEDILGEAIKRRDLSLNYIKQISNAKPSNSSFLQSYSNLCNTMKTHLNNTRYVEYLNCSLELMNDPNFKHDNPQDRAIAVGIIKSMKEVCLAIILEDKCAKNVLSHLKSK